MAQIPNNSLHKFLTGEIVDGDGAPTGANLNPVFETIRVAHNDTDTKLASLTAATYTKTQIDTNNYTKAQADNLLALKSDISTIYTQTQLNNGQLDTRYYTKALLDQGQLDSRYYTETELNNGQLDNRYFTQILLNNGQLDTRYYTESEIDAKFVQYQAGQVVANTLDRTKFTTDVQKAINSVDTNAAPTPVSLANGLQVINCTQCGSLQNFFAQGRTLVNLLGQNGGCKDTSKFTYTAATAAVDTTRSTTGSESIKLTKSAADGYVNFNNVYPSAGDYYIFIADVYLETIATGLYLNNSFSGITITPKNVSPNSSGYTPTTVGQFFPFIVAYSVSAVTTPGTSYFNPQLQHTGGATDKFNIDSVRIYKITVDDYNALGTSISLSQAQALAAKYPYVDDVKNLSGLGVTRYGENLLPDFSQWGQNTSFADSITDPYRFTFTAPSNATNGRSWDVAVVGTKTYMFTVNREGTSGRVRVTHFDANYAQLSDNYYNQDTSILITTFANTRYLRILLSNEIGASAWVAGTITFSNPRLNIGTTDRGFKPRNDDYMIFPVALASSVDGTVYDQIFQRDSRYWRENRFVKDMVLDGSLAWAYDATGTGYKRVTIPMSTSPSSWAPPYPGVMTKYDGKNLDNTGSGVADSFSFFTSSTGVIKVSIPSTDSGWGDSWTGAASATGATASQIIQAYFNGWKYTGNFTTDSWVSLVDGSASPTQTIAYVTVNKSANYKPYKLTYQLYTPTFDDLAGIMEGSLNLLEGLNHIEVSAGWQLREKATPFSYSDGSTYINDANAGLSTSMLRNRESRFTGIYKNGRYDPTWTQISSSAAYGNHILYKSTVNYDPSAVYEVTYQALDQYLLTSSPVNITGEYDTNIKTVQDRSSQTVADLASQVSVLQLSKAQKKTPQWIAPTLLNGWVNYGVGTYSSAGYYKDDFGIVHIRGMLKSGTTATFTSIFQLPVGYRPVGGSLYIPTLCFDGTAYKSNTIRITLGGSIDTGENMVSTATFLLLDNISFLAE